MPPITTTQLGAVLGGYRLERTYVSWSAIAPSLKLAALASEDQRFAVHQGFDWKAIEKSIQDKPGSGRGKRRPKGSAASTISQQTAKNVFLWQGSGTFRYIRKVPEAIYTCLIEWVWGKRRILEVYLNVAEMGPGVFGVEAASQKYFHKSAYQVSEREAAMLIACLPNPKRYTVRPVSGRVRWRTPQIVRQMQLIKQEPNIRNLVFQ